MLLLLAILAVAGSVIALLNACSKNEMKVTEKKSYQYCEFTPEEGEVLTLIETFNANYENYKLGYKGDEEMSLSEAVWTVEACLNFEFCELRDGFNELYADSTFEVFQIMYNDEGEAFISLDDVIEGYENFQNFVEITISSGNNSKFILADVSVASSDENSSTLTMTILGGYYSPYSCNIQSGDWWYSFDGLGRCNNLTPTYEGLDAMKRLDIAANCAEPYCSTGSPFYYNIETSEMGGALTGSANNCVNPDLMQTYLTTNLGYISLYKPTGKTFLSCISYKDFLSPPSTYGQVMVVSYGNWYCQGGTK